MPFDLLARRDAFETVVLGAIDANRCAAIVGARGGGKSSLLAHVCDRLSDGHIGLRVPITGVDGDPVNVADVAAAALGRHSERLGWPRISAMHWSARGPIA